LKAAQRKIQGFNEQRAETHRGRLEKEFREAHEKMRLISGIYTAFVFGGGLFIVASSIFFFQAVAKPLRRLVWHAKEIAEGKLNNTVPVTSTDEIGQLSYIFNFMIGRLKENEARLKALATIEERELVAQELHDSLAQDLAILRLKLSAAENDLTFDKGVLLRDVLIETRKSIERTYKDVRQAILGLHAINSKSLDFVPTLTEYLHNFSDMSKIPVDLNIDNPEAMRFSPEVEIQLIRIIHEALTNIFKHAHATRGAIKFEREKEFVKLAIEDNGTGLVTGEGGRRGLRFGLQSMKKRAEGIGGQLLIDSVVGKGTRVIVHIPFTEAPYGANSNSPGR
jgi:nitrate/nitrite-specific signal transduction histidine kinase